MIPIPAGPESDALGARLRRPVGRRGSAAPGRASLPPATHGARRSVVDGPGDRRWARLGAVPPPSPNSPLEPAALRPMRSPWCQAAHPPALVETRVMPLHVGRGRGGGVPGGAGEASWAASPRVGRAVRWWWSSRVPPHARCRVEGSRRRSSREPPGHQVLQASPWPRTTWSRLLGRLRSEPQRRLFPAPAVSPRIRAGPPGLVEVAEGWVPPPAGRRHVDDGSRRSGGSGAPVGRSRSRLPDRRAPRLRRRSPGAARRRSRRDCPNTRCCREQRVPAVGGRHCYQAVRARDGGARRRTAPPVGGYPALAGVPGCRRPGAASTGGRAAGGLGGPGVDRGGRTVPWAGPAAGAAGFERLLRRRRAESAVPRRVAGGAGPAR
ncbi:hypothetical protein G443_003278 [Actinoalloteichus cyanogriseus DSM 43889]|uniref:Basic proline-rich protein n=1 Tax=Actinoalloteichus caeruleus DSM 43889 TaxID=1120930 RepID=A0ABT1JKG9_ACTCY|nr:hypothetical protein [Actinoalloteichus caeruleus DSM 43889]